MPESSREADASPWRLDRKVPLMVIVVLAVQTGGALMWAGGEARRISELELRLDRQSGVAERLARLEAGADATRAVLARIEAKLDREPGR